LIKVGVQPQSHCPGAHVGQGCPSRLLHDVAELAGDGQFTGTGHDGGLDLQELTADLGPGHAGGQTDLVVFFGKAETVFCHTQEALDSLRRDPVFFLRFFILQPLTRHLAANTGEGSLQAAHASLTGIAANNIQDGLFIEGYLVGLKSISLELFG